MKIYILRIRAGTPNKLASQLVFHMSINEFVRDKFAIFRSGIAVIPESTGIPESYTIDRDLYDSLMSCNFIDDLINWLKNNRLWSDWMSNWSNIGVETLEVGNIGGE